MRTHRTAPKATGLVIAGVGGLLMLFALLADVIDVGGGEGFGYQQMIVFIVGMVLALGGGALLMPYTSSRPADGYRPDRDIDSRQ